MMSSRAAGCCIGIAVAYFATLGAASAQTSSERISADPRSHYEVVKRILRTLFEQDLRETAAANEKRLAELKKTSSKEWRQQQDFVRREQRKTDLYNCATGDLFMPEQWLKQDEIMVPLANLALDFVALEHNIARFSRRKAKFLEQLARRLNQERKANSSLPRLVVDGGCGAGEITVQIATDPPGAQVLFIPTFFYELCRAQKLQADDPWGNCSERWREAVDGTVSRVSGDYHYVARWSDGATRRGRLRMTDVEDGQTIKLLRP
jgi:hypothetical protein